MFVYADNAATTPMCKNALDAMLPYLTTEYGNPSSAHAHGEKASKAIQKARRVIAAILGADSKELYFTSSGTESDNWAFHIAAEFAAMNNKSHFISSAFEHHAVLHTLSHYEKQGFRVTLLPVYNNGIVRPADLENAICDDTALVSIMYANNEIGTIQPITELAAICRKHNVLFHTDAVQAVGHLPINVHDQNIDLLSLSAHKFAGPKGIGALFCRKGIPVHSLLHGGAQERGKRAGTENVAAIIAMAAALQTAADNLAANNKHICALRDKLIDGISSIARTQLNGDRYDRLPGIANFSFEGIDGVNILLNLDRAGICASSGSACSSSSLDPSHVLRAIGLPHDFARSSIRFSLSESNSEEQIDFILDVLPPIIDELRAISPAWSNIIKNRDV